MEASISPIECETAVAEVGLLDATLALASEGFFVFPLPPQSKYPSSDTPTPSEATRDPGQIIKWWTETPDANIGIATGAEFDLLVVEVVGSTGEESLKAREARSGPLPETREVSWGKRDSRVTVGANHRRCLYFRYPSEVESIKGSLGQNLNIRTSNKLGFTVAPPSIVRGTRYEWLNDQPLVDLPEWAKLKLAVSPITSRVNPKILARRPLDPKIRSEILEHFQDNKLLAYRTIELEQPPAYRQGRPAVSVGQNEFYRAMRGEEINSDYADFVEYSFNRLSREGRRWNSPSLRELPDDLEELQKWIKLHIGSITKLHAMLFADWSYPTVRNVVAGKGTEQNEQELRARLKRFRQRRRHELRAKEARANKAAMEEWRSRGFKVPKRFR